MLRWEGTGSYLTHMSVAVHCTSQGEPLQEVGLQVILVCRDNQANSSPCTSEPSWPWLLFSL